MSNIGYLIYHNGRLCVLEMDAFCLPPEPPYVSGCVWPVLPPTNRVTIEHFLGVSPAYGGKWLYEPCSYQSDRWIFKNNTLSVKPDDAGHRVSIGGFRIDYPKPPSRSAVPLRWTQGHWTRNGKPVFTQVVLDETGNIVFRRDTSDRWATYRTIPLKDVLK